MAPWNGVPTFDIPTYIYDPETKKYPDGKTETYQSATRVISSDLREVLTTKMDNSSLTPEQFFNQNKTIIEKNCNNALHRICGDDVTATLGDNSLKMTVKINGEVKTYEATYEDLKNSAIDNPLHEVTTPGIKKGKGRE